VGRAQEITYALNQLIEAGAIPPIPVYVDSPLAVNAAKVFQEHTDLYDPETQAFMRHNHGQVFTFKSLKYTQSVDESKAINDQAGPLVIISASGMCESGRILHHLRNNIGDARNTILIVSWQAPNTLGRRLADRELSVRIFGETFERKAQVVTINGYSGHAGRDFLLKWAGALQPHVKNIFLAHGEPDSMKALAEGLREQGKAKVYAPTMHETVRI
jgi:metallo-beta-lactamase family protein